MTTAIPATVRYLGAARKDERGVLRLMEGLDVAGELSAVCGARVRLAHRGQHTG